MEKIKKMIELRKKIFKNVKRIVIKVGTSLVINRDNENLSLGAVGNIARQVYELKNSGMDIVIVSSGAIGGGMKLLGLDKRPVKISQQQAAAAIGQVQLMNDYGKYFHNLSGGVLTVAQILLTQDDFSDRKRYLNMQNTLATIFSYKTVVPVINENDTVSTEEIKFGDNDKLSGLVCSMVNAQLLIILSDVDGVLADGQKRINVVKKITPSIEKLAKGTTKENSSGGMVTKLQAAKAVTADGAACVIANGHTANVLNKILNSEDAGTLFLPQIK